MYSYLKTWPSDRENGWSEELNGVCHDDNYWYFTQNGNLWKFPYSHNLNEKIKKANASKGILKKAVGKTLGDIDCYGSYLFVPVKEKNASYIAVYKKYDLSYICREDIKRFGESYDSINWCAINPNDGCLYTSDKNVSAEFSKESSAIMVYKIDLNKIGAGKTNFLTQKTYLAIYDENGAALVREQMQGGCFDNDNNLYITNGGYTIKGGSHNWANEKGGISVFKVPTIGDQPRYNIQRISHSNQDKGFRYQFNGTGEEPQGITYWDLSGKNKPNDLCGELHCIMLDNCGTGDDDFYFKHFSKNRSFKAPAAMRTKKKVGLIITAKAGSPGIGEEARRKQNRQMMIDLFKKRGIDYTVVVDHTTGNLGLILKSVYGQNGVTMGYFYANCHGDTNYVQIGYDGTNKGLNTVWYYYNLENLLKPYNYKKVIMIDACHSGGASSVAGKYNLVLCSARIDENAKEDNAFGGYATRYWSAGAGNDFIAGAADDLEADFDKNGKVTLKELCTYTNGKLSKWSISQRCVMYPDDCNEVIFE